MAKLTLDLSVADLREVIAQLPPDEFLQLAEAIEEHAETLAMMKPAETGSQEWNEEGEDVYDASARPAGSSTSRSSAATPAPTRPV